MVDRQTVAPETLTPELLSPCLPQDKPRLLSNIVDRGTALIIVSPMLAAAPPTPSHVRVFQVLIVVPHLVARARARRRPRDKDLAIVAPRAVHLLAALGRAVVDVVVADELVVDGAVAVAHKVDGAAAHAATLAVKGRRDLLVVEVGRVVNLAGEVVLGAIRVRVVEVVPGRVKIADGQGKGVGGLDVLGDAGDLVFRHAVGPLEAGLEVSVAVGNEGVDGAVRWDEPRLVCGS